MKYVEIGGIDELTDEELKDLYWHSVERIEEGVCMVNFTNKSLEGQEAYKAVALVAHLCAETLRERGIFS